jgi:Sel1 repeat
MKRFFPLAVAVLVFSSIASATDFYGSSNGSVRDSAVPGEYFFQKGVEAVRKDDYRHAVAMYKVAASWAYKPAEYNLGVIFAKGEGGVPVDLPQSYAWMQLAAERDDADYVSARDHVKSALSPEDLKQSDVLLADMMKTYGDGVAFARAKARWRDVLDSATGSRVGATGGNLQVGGAQVGFRGNPTQASKNVAAGGKAGARVSGITTASNVLGGTGEPGSIAYRELRATDNPYDPRFNVGVITVGDPNGLGPKDDKAKPANAPEPSNNQ